jgi:hypothetical protein
MWFSCWLANRNPSQAGRRGRTPGALWKQPAFRPQLEALESRWLPSTLTVTTTADSGPGSLRADVAAAQSGDTIAFAPGLAGQTVFLTSGELVINKRLTIQGPGAPQAPVTISGGGFSRVFEIDGATTNLTLSNLNLTGGNGLAGNASVAGALDGQGGAIWNGGTLTLSACTLSNNTTAHGALNAQGGAIYNAGNLTLNACTLSGNSSYSANAPLAFGGAVYNAGTMTVGSSTLSNNAAGIQSFEITEGGDGGAIYNAGTMTVTSGTLSGNWAYLDGGGTGGYGGGIFNAYKASATVTGSSLSNNVAQQDGGGISNDGTMTLSGSTLSGNDADDGRGGGIFNDHKGRLTIQSKSSIVNNYSYDLYNLGLASISKDSSVGTTVK